MTAVVGDLGAAVRAESAAAAAGGEEEETRGKEIWGAVGEMARAGAAVDLDSSEAIEEDVTNTLCGEPVLLTSEMADPSRDVKGEAAAWISFAVTTVFASGVTGAATVGAGRRVSGAAAAIPPTPTPTDGMAARDAVERLDSRRDESEELAGAAGTAGVVEMSERVGGGVEGGPGKTSFGNAFDFAFPPCSTCSVTCSERFRISSTSSIRMTVTGTSLICVI